MHAIVQHRFGGPDTLGYEQVGDPMPAPGQARIAVRAAGVHLIDTMFRRGIAPGPHGAPRLPMTPGREVAGTIDAVGDDGDAQWIGRRVVAHLGMASGGYAELALADIGSLHLLPDAVSFVDALAMVGTGRTALMILRAAAITAEDVVVVTSAAGGLGALLVQGAKQRGARVIGVAGGPTKVATVRSLGADEAVDYLDPEWPTIVRHRLNGRRVTIGLDGVGGAIGRQALELITDGGRMVVFGASSGDGMVEAPDSTTVAVAPVVGPGAALSTEVLAELTVDALDQLAAGRLRPLVHPPFELADAATAHRALESRATSGKVVLIP